MNARVEMARGLLARLLTLGLGLVVMMVAPGAWAVDSDSDGMSDEFEAFFGLDLTNAADGALNYDSDSLANSNEAALWTDPRAPDSDADGFQDDADDSPVGRALLDWGAMRFTQGDDLNYTWPNWMVAGYRLGGDWQTNTPTAWHVSAAESNGVGSLGIEFSRSLLTTDAVLTVEFFDSTNSSLYADLYDSNAVSVVTNLFGNMLQGANATSAVSLGFPLGSYPTAVGIRLRRQSGEITVYESLLFVDLDGDGLDADQEVQVGTSDLDIDSDNDGLSDLAEVFTHGTEPTDVDTDDDGMNDGLEVFHGRDPTLADVYGALPFAETFETNTCAVGPIHGQNNWSASPTNRGSVQTNRVHGGVQALAMETGTNAAGVVSQFFQNPGQAKIWADFYLFALAAEAPTGTVADTAAFFFSDAGQPVLRDGNAWITNQTAVATGTWVRVTVKLDYALQAWDIALNAIQATQGMAFAAASSEFSAFTLEAGGAYADDITIATEPPHDLDLDQDGLPDWWEENYFGNLGQVALGEPDADGLNNGAEYAAGTDPTARDSDLDDMADGVEAFHGQDPATSNLYSTLPFVDGFETNTCLVGPLHGQNLWTATPTNGPQVQTNLVQAGSQALQVEGAAYTGRVDHLIGSAGVPAVWLDSWVQALPADDVSGPFADSGACYFNAAGSLVVRDGADWSARDARTALALTGEWVRVTVKLDYAQQTWLVCVNGLRVAEELGFATNTPEFSSFRLDAVAAGADTLTFSTNQPAQLSLDGDGLIDEWELAHFGNLSEADAGDPDADGLSNLGEYVAGTDSNDGDSDNDGLGDWYEIHISQTDPLAADSDGDGLGDAWEIRYGLDPNAADSAGADLDGDSLTNAHEEALGTNPFLADSDGDGVNDGADPTPLLADQDDDPTGPAIAILTPKDGEMVLW